VVERVRPDDWTPGVWTHAAVMEMQARLDPARMTRHADDWHTAVDQIRDVLTELNRQVTAQLGEAWRGHGADAALASVQRYAAGSLDGLALCRSAAVQLAELSRAAGDLRASITAPGAQDVAGQLLGEALSQVRQLYSGPAVAAGNGVADIPEPPDPLPIGGPATESVLPAGSATTPAGSATPPAAGLADAPLGSALPQAFDAEGRSRPSMSAADTQPLWRVPTSSAAFSSPGVEPLPSRGEPPGATSTPPPSGMPAAVGPESPRAPGRMSSSSPFTPFLGTAHPGLLGRGDNPEHRAPRYLISAGNTSELIGELPLVAPPVIGE